MTDRIIAEIFSKKNEDYATHHYKFFKAFKGGYGEGDEFIGLKVPEIRKIAKDFYATTSNSEIEKLIKNKYHEIRLCALFIMILKSKNDMDNTIKIYLNNLDYVNNWDLVDLSASYLVGNYCYNKKDVKIMDNLSDTKKLWQERISVVSSYYFIKRGDFSLTIKYAEKFLTHKHDLMHKACGWMLREVGKMDEAVLKSFLDKFYRKMPRTMLRYAIERLPKDLKTYYMQK